MPITAAQKAAAEQHQWNAAHDPAPQVRLVAGPGTGKTRTIEKRVAHVIVNGATAGSVFVISFTRATCAELRKRISTFLNANSLGAASSVHVSTMHALALRILRLGNLLNQYPSDPTVLDDWEQEHVYDIELAGFLGCTPGRARQIRVAHDAGWQTLNPALIAQARVTQAEMQGFGAFHASRTNLYSCVLPGEVIYKCVQALQQGSLQISQLPPIEHLIVDEFQDLNACDQEFVRLLCSGGGVLFVAGDDDQSIYTSLRHSNPDGVVQFQTVYPAASSHILSECFRCTASILVPAGQLIAYNPGRQQKNLTPLYSSAAPPVQGSLLVWSFPTADHEARAIAVSCRELLNAGMAGREDEILVLVSNRRVQLDLIARELGNLGLPFDAPSGGGLTEDEPIRAAYCVLRIAKDQATGTADYPAHRALLALLSGVGPGTAKAVADACVANSQNFRGLFYLPSVPSWLTGRAASAVQRLTTVVQVAGAWSMVDTLTSRVADISSLLSAQVFTSGIQVANHLATWNALASSLPQQMTLDDLTEFLGATTESDQQSILDLVNQRISAGQPQAPAAVQKKIRILTMHGAKGLDGKVVFIPSAEQGIMPSFRALNATGLVIEHRRLFYVSLTRAMAACIVSHSAMHTGAAAYALRQQPNVRLSRSQFLTEMGIPSVNRASGLTADEAARIVAEVNNL